MNRRQFLEGSIAAGALLSHSSAQASEAGWYDRPMRWMQLAFVEDDPGNYDRNFWLDYF
jgi:hypothetical protein